MRMTASSTAWSSRQYAISVDITSFTLVLLGSRPSAVALMVISRSVSNPFKRSPSQTGIKPTSSFFILVAASFNEALPFTTSTLRVMISLNSINHFPPFSIGLANIDNATDMPEVAGDLLFTRILIGENNRVCAWASIRTLGPTFLTAGLSAFFIQRLGAELGFHQQCVSSGGLRSRSGILRG